MNRNLTSATVQPINRNKISTIGFGVPATSNPHHFEVNVPSTRKDTVDIWEHLGMKTIAGEDSTLLRCKLRLSYWKKVKREVQASFNKRLKDHKLKTSSWKTGHNLVDRLLGKELCVLAWTIEDLSDENIPLALNSWIGLRPEERWWLFGMVVRASEEDYQKGYGWRAALKIALTSEPKINQPPRLNNVNSEVQNLLPFSLK